MGRSPKAGQRSAPAAAAYRAGTKLLDEHTGVIHDYRAKRGVEHAEILAPARAGAWATDRGQLWNTVEAAERRRDAQLAREFRLSIPHQLGHAERVELVRDWVQRELVSRGMVADVAIHSPHHGGKNFHAHVMTTTRHLSADGLVFAGKAREWNGKELLFELRESWAEAANAAALEQGHAIGWTHLSLAAQVEQAQAAGDFFTATAKSYTPTVHEGPKVQAVRKALQSRAHAEGVQLTDLLDQLDQRGESTGAHEIIRHNEAAREERAAQQELAAAQREQEEAQQEQARVIDARAKFEERQRAAQKERKETDDMGAVAAAWDPAHDLPPLAESLAARTPAPSSPPEQVAGVDKKGAALGGFGGVEKPAPESPGPEQQPATPEDAEQWLDTRDRLAAVAEKLQEQQDQHQQQLKQLQQSQQQLPELPGQSFFGRMRDLVSRVPGFRWIGPSAFTLAAGAHARHQEQADAAQEQGAKLLQGQQLLADQQQKLAGAHERPGMAEAVEKVQQHREDLQAGASAWHVGRRKFSDQMAGACRDLRLAVSDLDAARKEQYDPTAPSGGAAYEALGGWQQLAREQLQELEQELQELREAAEPTDQQALLAHQHGFQPTDQQAELLQAGVDLARDAQQVPGQIEQEQQSARIDQQLQQRADQQQSQTQRSSSGPRMG